jgi:hypothetical protein
VNTPTYEELAIGFNDFGQREEEERVKVEVPQRESKRKEQQEEEAPPSIFKHGPPREKARFPQTQAPTIAPSRSQAKTKWLLAGALDNTPVVKCSKRLRAELVRDPSLETRQLSAVSKISQ